MFDPRADVKNLFTNNRISGKDKYGNTAYVDIQLREENTEGTIVREGIMIFEPPRAVVSDLEIGDSKTLDEVVFDCNLYVIRKPQIKDYHSFINSIVDSFQSTIKSNRHSLSCCDDIRVSNMLSPPVPEASRKTVFRRLIEVTSWRIA